MKIESLQIDGFGHFSNRSFDNLNAPLTVVIGHNEAGKSTLLAFIRTMLFGFPGRLRAEHYPALNGGRHGGRLVALGDDGIRYTVERTEDTHGTALKITTSTGLQGSDEGMLRPLIGSSSRAVFESVFAFGLADLQDIKGLNASDASAQIYAAGMGATNLPRAMKALEDARGKLFTKGGSNQEAAKLLNLLKDVEEKLEAARGDAAEYAVLTSRRTELEVELDAANARVAAVSSRLGELANLKQAWNDWNELNEAEALLNEHPAQPGFPEDAVVRLDQAQQAVAAAELAEREAAQQHAIAEQRANAPVPGEILLAQRDRIAEITRGRGAFEHSVADLPKRKAELASQERDLAETISDLGPDWTEARVLAFDTSIPTHDPIEQWRTYLEDAARNAREATASRQRAAEAARDAAEAEQKARTELESLPKPPIDTAALADARVALRASRQALEDFRIATARRADAEALTTQARAITPVVAMAPLLPAWLFSVLLGAGMISIVGSVAVGGGGALFGMVIGLILVAAGAFGLLRRRGADSVAAGSGTGIEAADPHVALLRAQEETARAAVESVASRFGNGVPTAALLDEAEVQLERTESALRDLDSARKHWQQQRDDDRRLATRAEEAAAVLEEAEHKLAAANNGWNEWLRDHGLPATLRPATVLALIARIDTARAKIQAIREPRERPLKIEADIRRYFELVQPLATEYGLNIDPARSSTVLAATDRLIGDYDAANKAATRREQSREAIDEGRAALERLATRTVTAQKQLAALLALGNAVDAEDLRRKAASHLARLAAEQRHREAESRLRLLSGPGESYRAFRAALQTTSLATIEEQHALLADERDEADHNRERLRDERASVSSRIDQLSSDDVASQLRAERAVLIEQLRDCGRRWSTFTLARTLLLRAQRKYEEERQPDVLRNAQEFFARVTGGRYERLISPLGTQTITAVARDGASKETSQLSRGTEDQLYLALRFGLVREFGARAANLPVVVDDILVNFDPERAQRTARAFADLSHTNQVLVFTCHPTTVEFFRTALPSTQVIELS